MDITLFKVLEISCTPPATSYAAAGTICSSTSPASSPDNLEGQVFQMSLSPCSFIFRLVKKRFLDFEKSRLLKKRICGITKNQVFGYNGSIKLPPYGFCAARAKPHSPYRVSSIYPT